MTLSPREKLSLAAQIDAVRVGLLIEAEDEDYLPRHRDSFRELIQRLDQAGEEIAETAWCIEGIESKERSRRNVM